MFRAHKAKRSSSTSYNFLFYSDAGLMFKIIDNLSPSPLRWCLTYPTSGRPVRLKHLLEMTGYRGSERQPLVNLLSQLKQWGSGIPYPQRLETQEALQSLKPASSFGLNQHKSATTNDCLVFIVFIIPILSVISHWWTFMYCAVLCNIFAALGLFFVYLPRDNRCC